VESTHTIFTSKIVASIVLNKRTLDSFLVVLIKINRMGVSRWELPSGYSENVATGA